MFYWYHEPETELIIWNYRESLLEASLLYWRKSNTEDSESR